MKILFRLLPLLALTSCASIGGGGDDTVRYVCMCGDDCDCGTVSSQPGKCKCGEYLIPE